MLKQFLSLMIVGLLVNMVGAVPADAASKGEEEARFVEKIKEGVRRLGTGEAARVEVTLRDKTKLKGYISKPEKTVSSWWTKVAEVILSPILKSKKLKVIVFPQVLESLLVLQLC